MLPLTYLQHKRSEQSCCYVNEYESNYQHLPFCKTEEQVVRENVQWLIERLYAPHVNGYRLAKNWPSLLGIPNADRIPYEPINWNGLGASVEKLDNVWIVTVKEATSGKCPALCEYVRFWLTQWGWTPVKVETAW